MKKVTVIIPNYNYGRFLDTCILSVLCQQTSFHVEILVSDDGSTDQSLEVLEYFSNTLRDHKFSFEFFSRTNSGEIQNTKFLHEQAKGDYIAYLDADDYWIDPNKLQKQYDFMENNKDYSMCFTGYLEYDESKKFFAPSRIGNYFLGPPSYYQKEEFTSPDFIASQYNCITSSSRFFVNYPDLFQKYIEEFPYSDWAINFEISLRGKIGYLEYPSYVYRVHQNSVSHSSENKILNPATHENWLSEKRKILNERKKQYHESLKLQ